MYSPSQLNTLLLYPMAFFPIYIFALVTRNLFIRKRHIKEGKLDPKYFKTYSNKSDVSEELLVLERHVDNQFQLPILFLVTCATQMATRSVSQISVDLAWVFVLLRLWHSYEHLGKNRVIRRAKIYALGWTVVIALWVQMFFTN